jgi:hypothetical protein
MSDNFTIEPDEERALNRKNRMRRKKRKNPIYPPPTFLFLVALRADGETFMLLLF